MLMEAVLLSLKDLEVKEAGTTETTNPTTIKADPTRTSTASSSDSQSRFMSPCNSTSSSNMTPTPPASSSDADMADRTKATVTVERTPSGNIMDGLLRRWDLNFFKNR